MKLHIKYFGMIEEAIGKSEENLELKTSLSVDELKLNLESKYASIKEKNFKIAVNQTIANGSQLISEDCEIAILPPFAGG